MALKEYLGDSVYIDFDGYYLVLTTENGFGPTNTIFLEPTVLAELLVFVQTLKEKIEEIVPEGIEEKP